MIIRKQLYSQDKLSMKTIYDTGMEFKPIYKKITQPNSSSPDTDALRDAEDLLKPIQQAKHSEDTNNQQSQSSKERIERNLWRNDEVMEMLYTMQQVKALEKLNDKTVKSENVFKDVEVIMHRNGFIKKSHVQIWTKWKFLKSTYMTSRRSGVIPRMVSPQIYETIHQMITGLNQSLADSCSSTDGDNSSVSGMVISGVEGGVSDVGVANEDDEDSFGMAHPIFGFRLGMVKSEPEDTSYDPVDSNGSDKDPLEEELLHSKSDKEVKEERCNTHAKYIKESEPVQKILEIPHRGRGRPPKNPPPAVSTLNNAPSLITKPTQMPPLRVAPFAKDIHSANNLAANRPPPPLTMPPTPRIRVANLSNLKSEPAKFVQPKLIPKPTHQQNSPSTQSTQTRSSSTPSPSYPKMKQIPMRKTPYSLRPDRAIPDLEASLSPPPPAIEKLSNKKLEELSTTKNLIQNSSNNLQNFANRKRRTEWQDPVHVKQAKYNHMIDDEQNSSKFDNTDYDRNYGKVLQNVIIDLSASLRKMQTEMMRDFFNKQNELLEREHKFQMQQDHMIMKAFQEQTQEIMHSVKKLVSSIKSFKNCQQNDSGQSIKTTQTNRKCRVQRIRAQNAINKDPIENHINNHQENNMENYGGEDQEIEKDGEDVYTDSEEQQDPIDDHAENIQEERDNEHQEDEDQSQSNQEQYENGFHTENPDGKKNSTHSTFSESNEDE